MNKSRLPFGLSTSGLGTRVRQATRPDVHDNAARARNITYAGLILFAASGTGIALNIYLLSRAPAWQLGLALCIVAGFGLATLVAVWLNRRGRLNLSGALLIADVVVVILGYGALIAGVGLPLGLMGLVVLIVLSSIVLPAGWMTGATIMSILTTVAASLLDLLGLPIQLTIPAIGATVYPVMGITVAALSIFVIRQFPSFPLASKLTIVLIAITLVSVGTVAALNNQTSSAVLTQTAGDNIQSFAESVAVNTANQLVRQVDLLKSLGLNRSLQIKLGVANNGYTGTPEGIQAQLLTLDKQWRAADALNNDADPLVQSKILDPLSPQLREHARSFPGNAEVFVTDRYGALVAATQRTSDYYQADEAWWQAAWKQGEGAVYIGKPEYDSSSSTFSVNIAIPVYDEEGKAPVGVLRTTYRVADLLKQVYAARIGLTGVAELYLHDGNKIAGLGMGTVPVDTQLLRQLEQAQLEGYATLVYDGRPSLITQVPVTASSADASTALAVSDLGWTIVAHQDRSESLRVVQAQTRNTLLLALVIASVVAFAALGIAQVLTRPIVNLTDAAQQVAGGDLSIQALVETTDEIGALAATFNAMTAQLRELIGSLEARVEGRTAQLRASAEVARAATSILDPQALLQQTVDLICDRFDYYYAGIFMLDGENRFAVLRAGRGEAGRAMLERGHKFEAADARQSMVGWVCVNRQARIALDVGEDAVRFANPFLPNTRSEIALPLQASGVGYNARILGVLDVQSTEVAAFDESHIVTLQGMADQIAVALENARLFSQAQTSLADNERLVAQVQANLGEATALYQLGQAISTAPDTPALFAAIVETGLQPEIELALLALFDESRTSAVQRIEISQVWTRAGSDVGVGYNDARLRAGAVSEFEHFPLRPLLSNDPAGKVLPCQDAAPELARSLPGLDTLAGVPLRIGARWIGTLVLGRAGTDALDASSDPQGAFGSWLQRYRAIASQAATAIDNHRLYERAQASLQELNTLYRTVTRQAWGRALEAKPHLSEYEYTGSTAHASGLGTSGSSTSGGAARLELPLTLRGQEIGVIELAGENRTSWTEPERALVEAIVTQTALALDSARLFDETQRLAGRERLINEITARIRASTSVSGILQTAARELAQAINVPHAVARINPPADDDKSA